MRLCSQAPNISPFVVGDYLTEEGQARLTVFDVEVLRASPGANGKSTTPTPPYLNMLAFLESGKSINYSQWEYWGPAVFDRELARSLSLRCLFFRGGNPSVKALEAPVFQSDVLIVDENEHFLYFQCRLPLPTELLHSSFLQSSHFQVQLVLQNGAAGILHMEPLPICRDNGNHMDNMGDIPGLQPYMPFNYSTSSKDSTRQKVSDNFNAPANSNRSVSICVRPFHSHPFFLPKASTHSNLRLLEFVNHHLLLGVRQIYFYDRFGTEMEPLLEAYIERGLVVHMPFPQWSEVFYRRESFFGKAKFPYDFPQMYDQIIHIQACLMQGRRNRDDWMFIIDTDEFLRYSAKIPGLLPQVMEKCEKNFARSHHGASLDLMRIRRYNFFGANNTFGGPVLQTSITRCGGPTVHVFPNGNFFFKDKVTVRPSHMLGVRLFVHGAENIDESRSMDGSSSVLRIHHYVSSSSEQFFGKGGEDCSKEGHPLEHTTDVMKDTTLFWVAKRIEECTKKDACGTLRHGECGSLCDTVEMR